ncbi:MAG: zinc ribbon domain-containing protein [Candidatus Methanomethylophilaceae archaeon]
MRRCPQCGATYDDGNSFCLRCGALLVQEEGVHFPPKAKQKADPSKIIAVFVAVMIIAAAIVVLYYPRTEEEVSNKLEFEWKYDGTDYTYKLELDTDYYNTMMTSTINRAGTSASDRYVIEDSNGDETTVFAVKDYIVVDEYIQKLVVDITALYEEKYGEGSPATDPIGYANYLLAFAQYIPYDYEEADSGKDYWRYPLETLYDGIGDCEDKSILAAAMYAAADIADIVEISAGVFILPSHLMVAVNDTIGTMEGAVIHSDYYSGETTNTTWKLGEIANVFDQSYFHLYTGYSTEYYYD